MFGASSGNSTCTPPKQCTTSLALCVAHTRAAPASVAATVELSFSFSFFSSKTKSLSPTIPAIAPAMPSLMRPSTRTRAAASAARTPPPGSATVLKQLRPVAAAALSESTRRGASDSRISRASEWLMPTLASATPDAVSVGENDPR